MTQDDHDLSREFDKGVTVHTFPPPPAGFAPLTASAEQLAAHGFPPRQRDPHLRQRWETALSQPLTVVQPTFRRLERPPFQLPPTLLGPAAPPSPPPPIRTNYNGGATATTSTEQGNVRWIEGTFVLPDTRLPAGADSSTYPFSTWIGIYGDDSSSSLLAGWSSFVSETNRGLQYSNQVWWRWDPDHAVSLSNFTAVPGDTLSIVLCLDVDSVVRARITFHNLTTTQATSFIATAPRGTELEGNTAGWMVNNDIVDFEGPFISRFGEMYIDECNAGTTATPSTILHPTQRIYLTDFNDPTKDVVDTNILSDTLLQMRYVGP